jgi:hypothetical protein
MNNRHIIITLCALGCFAVLLPKAFAVNPVPDGCYPNFSTAEGCDALNSLTIGAGNTALGWRSLFLDTAGSFNTALGAGALVLNNADSNTAVGAAALLLNTSGSENTAVGTDAMVYNDTGTENTAVGAFALRNNTTGNQNTAYGYDALSSNNGNANTAVGEDALHANVDGDWNTAIGTNAMKFTQFGLNTVGLNTAVGANALDSNQFGGLNIALGWAAGDQTTGDNNIVIGHIGTGAEANTIRIGAQTTFTDQFGVEHPAHTATYIAGISGQAASDGVAVYVNTDGKLGTLTSSARFKTDIRPMDKASQAILALKPVSFQYKSDSKGTPQFGLIAEEVAKVNPDLVVRDRNGEIYSVRYEAVNAMLLNEFLKEHQAFIEEQRKVEKLQTTVACLAATVKDQAAQIQRVSVQLKVSKFATGRIRGGGPGQQVVTNP